MKAIVTEHGTQVVRNGELVATLSHAEAVQLALELLAAQSTGATAAYGEVEWLTVGDLVRELGLPRSSASRLMDRFVTTHTRVPGGDRYVARGEVDAWAARAVAPVRRKHGTGGTADSGGTT